MDIKKIIISLAVIVGVGFSVKGIADTIKFSAVKPSASKALTDEQQGILAVRTAKASVVSIIGVSKTQINKDGLEAGTGEKVSATGFVWDADGTIVTNNHVVENSALNYFVLMPDGTQYPAKIIGNDRYDDLGLLKIDAQGLIPARLGDSDALETGQSVFAIGNSLGRYENSVTRGVVSGLLRSIKEDPSNASTPAIHNWIQTDAAINLGNSGGPLINMAGEVIGVPTVIDLDGSSLGFAVPVNTIKDSVNQLKTFGRVSRPFLGVQFATIDSELKQVKKLSQDNGALVIAVSPGTPAVSAGLLAGDIIVSVNGQNLTARNPLDAIVQRFNSGNQITLKIYRNGQFLDLPIVLGQIP